MDRRFLLKLMGLEALLPLTMNGAFASGQIPTSAWPSKSAWKALNDAVDGNLIAVDFPLSLAKKDPDSDAAEQLWKNLKNPYYIADQPGLTQTLGWVDAWTSEPSVYAVIARSARHIVAAVNFARENNVRLVVKGRGHSYLGGSNAPRSLLIWTRHMQDITMHAAFVPQGCEKAQQPQPAVTVGAGTYGMQAYQEVTTKAGKYVQAGGCTTVGFAGLLQGGGFGSFSKHYGLAAASLLEAEVVTADGQIRIANACTNPDLFWALKGGGGGTFGVVSKMTVRLHDLPEYFGAAVFKIKAATGDAFKRLLQEFVGFYREHLFNHHWGEQANIGPDNVLDISMVSYGLSTDQAKKIWQPFLDRVRATSDLSVQWPVVISSRPARTWWDVKWIKADWPEMAFPSKGNTLVGMFDYALEQLIPQPIFSTDDRSGASPDNVWWKGDGGQVGWYIWGYESLWLPEQLLAPDSEKQLADALFEGSRRCGIGLHFNKGLAGAPSEALAASKDTATNPSVLSAFALAIAADGEQPAYPGIRGHEPSMVDGRAARLRIRQGMNCLRALVPSAASYVNETNYFEVDWQRAFWGDNYARLVEIKRKYDPQGLFTVHHGVGTE